MKRREFIMKSVGLLALPLIIQQIGCDQVTNSDTLGNGNDEDDLTGTPNNSDDGFTVTSSVNSSHSHTVKILYDDIDIPPTPNKTLTSSSTGHTHQITISTIDYQTLAGGETIVKTSPRNGGHNHTFSIKVS